VHSTGRPARIDDSDAVSGTPAEIVRRFGLVSVVGVPIRVEQRLWGVVVAGSRGPDPIAADAEERMTGFTELVATAIANAESRAELAASRARVVEASTDERRRIVRDLHDGAQQRLVHTIVTLKLALRELGSGSDRAEPLLRDALEQATDANGELRELVHGIMPRVLTSGGLRAAVEALADRCPVPLRVDVVPGRLPAAIEATAYFVTSEALTNVAKHAAAQEAAVTARLEDQALRLEVHDDGVGGADARRGSGLVGLRDRVEALGGTLEVRSPRGGGTAIVARIPLAGD